MAAGGDEPAQIRNEAKAQSKSRTQRWRAFWLLLFIGLCIKIPPRMGTIFLALLVGAVSAFLVYSLLMSTGISG